jgi:hypothetical protein
VGEHGFNAVFSATAYHWISPKAQVDEVRRYDWNQTYTAAGYRKLMLSYSGTQMMTPPARQGLLDDMVNFVRQQFGNQVTRPIVVTLTTATAT